MSEQRSQSEFRKEDALSEFQNKCILGVKQYPTDRVSRFAISYPHNYDIVIPRPLQLFKNFYNDPKKNIVSFQLSPFRVFECNVYGKTLLTDELNAKNFYEEIVRKNQSVERDLYYFVYDTKGYDYAILPNVQRPLEDIKESVSGFLPILIGFGILFLVLSSRDEKK